MTRTENTTPAPSDPNPYIRNHPGHRFYARGYDAAMSEGVACAPADVAATNRNVNLLLAIDASDAGDKATYRSASDLAAYWWGYANAAVLARKG